MKIENSKIKNLILKYDTKKCLTLDFVCGIIYSETKGGYYGVCI